MYLSYCILYSVYVETWPHQIGPSEGKERVKKDLLLAVQPGFVKYKTALHPLYFPRGTISTNYLMAISYDVVPNRASVPTERAYPHQHANFITSSRTINTII